MRLLIVGGSDAGIAAALRARERDPAVKATVLLADRYPNFSICGLPFFISGETPDWQALAHRTTAEIESGGVELLPEHTAEHIDPTAHTLDVTGPDGRTLELGYDRLVIGTGAMPIRPRLEGIDLPGVHVLHTMADSFAVHDTAAGARTAVVIGAGYIGVEMADALTHRGVSVALVEQLPSVLATVDPELGADVAAELSAHGVTISTGVAVEHINTTEDGRLLVTGTAGFSCRADLVLVAGRAEHTLGGNRGRGARPTRRRPRRPRHENVRA